MGCLYAVVTFPDGLKVFNHDVQHEGLPVLSGRKYILRTDSASEPLFFPQ